MYASLKTRKTISKLIKISQEADSNKEKANINGIENTRSKILKPVPKNSAGSVEDKSNLLKETSTANLRKGKIKCKLQTHKS